MKECWPEGSLRAYHDGELLPADMERVAAHLAECPACEALADEVAGRALRVANLMSALPEPEQVIWMPRTRSTGIPVCVPAWRRWIGPAAALAAGIAIALLFLPNRAKPPVPIAAIDPGPMRIIETPPPPELSPVQAVRHTPRRSRPRQVFYRLDDDPIETGFIVRVALGEAEIPADVVFGADGRAHAIRLVSNPIK